MGNRYRCAGSASETYINNERVYDRVDVKTPNQPTYSAWVPSFVEFNGLMYISWFHVPESNYWDLYTFDGEKFTKYASFSVTLDRLCVFNNALYAVSDNKLYRIDGTSLTYIIDMPSDGEHVPYNIPFVFGNNLYILDVGNSFVQLPSYIFRFTGSGWTQVVSTDAHIFNPVIRLYNGAIHILSYDKYQQQEYRTHLIFNGSTLTNGAELPGSIQRNAAYVINNKLRVFRTLTDQDSGTDVYELSGNTWSENTVLNFDGWVNKRTLFQEIGITAFYYKGEQYLLNVVGSLTIKITNPIRMGQYFISS